MSERPDLARVAGAGIAALAAVLVLGGLALSLVDWLGAAGWLTILGLCGVVLVLAVGGREHLAKRAVTTLLAGAAVAMAVGAVVLSHASAEDQARETRFTQLWFVPAGQGGRTEIGVRNEQQRPVALRLRVFGPASRGSRLLLDRAIRLDPGRSWSKPLELPATRRPERVNAELYRPGVKAPYRSAHLWTAVTR